MRPFVCANWKMNLNLQQMRELAAAVVQAVPANSGIDVALCPPHPYLFPMAKATANSSVAVGAQNLYFEADGAFTGEVSARMVAETGARFVILGHSERRHTIGHLEDDWMVNRKVKAALASDLAPILCVGETLAQRDRNETLEVLEFQLAAGLAAVALPQPDRLVIAYEPVWAIGTGRNATPQQAQEAHAHIRDRLRGVLGGAAGQVRILYGGSLKPENSRDLFSLPDVNGGLVGGASLKAETFLLMLKAAMEVAAKKG